MDLRKFSDGKLLLAALAAAAVVDTAGLFVWRYTADRDGPINTWYDKFGVIAYVLDVSSVVVGFVIAQLVCSMIGGSYNLLFFLIVVVAVQMVHDILFGLFLVPLIPEGENDIMDLMKSYTTMKGSGWVLVVDALYMILTTLGALILYRLPPYVTWFTLLFVPYVTGYILTTHRLPSSRIPTPLK
jgi:hypothetical protein